MGALQEAFKLHRSNTQLAEFLGEARFDDAISMGAMRCLRRSSRSGLTTTRACSTAASSIISAATTARLAATSNDRLRSIPRRSCPFLPSARRGGLWRSGSSRRLPGACRLRRATAACSASPRSVLPGDGSPHSGDQHLSDAIRLDPALEECYHLLGLCYLDRHWNRKALDAFRQAQRLSPRKMRYEDLVAYLSGKTPTLAAITPQVKECVEQGERLLADGEGHKALAMYRRAHRSRARPSGSSDHLRAGLPPAGAQRGDRRGHPACSRPEPWRNVAYHGPTPR